MSGSTGPGKGRVVDLAATPMALPLSVMLDTNILAALLIPGNVGRGEIQRQRAEDVLQHLVTGGRIGYVASQSAVEIAHLVAIQTFKNELSRNREEHLPALQDRFPGQRAFGWPELMKVYDLPFTAAASHFRALCTALMASGVRFMAPPGYDNHRAADALSYVEALAREISRYRVDSADAAILMEARRAGISAIVTFDTDLRRASQDFYIHTWL